MMSEILTREELRDFMHRAFSNIKFELDEQGRLIGAHDQPFNRLLTHDAALRAEVERLREIKEPTKRQSYAKLFEAEARAEKAERERDEAGARYDEAETDCSRAQSDRDEAWRERDAAEARAEKLAAALREAERFIKWERLTASAGPILERIARALEE